MADPIDTPKTDPAIEAVAQAIYKSAAEGEPPEGVYWGCRDGTIRRATKDTIDLPCEKCDCGYAAMIEKAMKRPAASKTTEIVRRIENAIVDELLTQNIAARSWGNGFEGLNPPVRWSEVAKAAAAAHKTALAEAGYTIVPREPTEAMTARGEEEALRDGAHDCEVSMADVYRAMIRPFGEPTREAPQITSTESALAWRE